MKILHLNTERGWRGGERQTLWLAGALARRGHASVLAARPGQPLAARAREEGLEVFPVSPWGEWDPLAAHRLNRFIKSAGVDVVHAHAGHAVGLAAFSSLGTRAARVATRRVDFPLKGNLLSRWKYRRMHRVACISRKVREMVAAAGVPEDRTVLIPSGVDPSGYPSPDDRDRLRRAWGLSSGDKVLVHVGALVPHKDQATLLRAVARAAERLPNLKAVIVGDGPLEGDLRSLARELGIAERTVFAGRHPDPLGAAAMADVFVFSSKEEGLGTALLDALVMGVPTAATAAGGIPDIYGGVDAPELSPPGDPKALSANILKVLSDPGEARRRVERGRTLAANFTVDAMAAAYEALYRALPTASNH